MKIYIVRHGETSWNKERILQGQIDIELNDVGIKQAENIARRLKGHSFSKVFASDLKRASLTAEKIIEHHEIDIIYDERLRERHFGDYGGKKRDSVDLDSIKKDLLNGAPPNGESWLQIITRVKNFVDSLEGEGNILIVCHGGIIRALLHIFLEEDFAQVIKRDKPKNTSLYIIEKTEEKYHLLTENCTEHNN